MLQGKFNQSFKPRHLLTISQCGKSPLLKAVATVLAATVVAATVASPVAMVADVVITTAADLADRPATSVAAFIRSAKLKTDTAEATVAMIKKVNLFLRRRVEDSGRFFSLVIKSENNESLSTSLPNLPSQCSRLL